ncbi:MAG: hypothetical protein WA051_01075 [Minisyncoccia bacterium]
MPFFTIGMNTIEFPQADGHELLRIRNEIQRKLIERALPTGDNSDESKIDWINMNSAQFGELFDNQLVQNPNLINDFKADPDLLVKSFEIMLIGDREDEKSEDSTKVAA